MDKRVLYLMLAASGLTATGVATAQTVDDPVAELVRAGGVNKEDEVVVASFDLNDDGKNDLLITTGADLAEGGRMGPEWSLWLSNSSGSYDSGGTVQARGGTIGIARLPEIGNAKAIVAYEPNGGLITAIKAYYLNSSGKAESRLVGTIDTGGEKSPEENAALEERVFGNAQKVEPKRIPASQLWPKEGTSAEPPHAVPQTSQSDTIEVIDPFDQTRWLILSASNHKLLGYRLGNKRLISLDEAAEMGLPLERNVYAERQQIAAKAEQDRVAKLRVNRPAADYIRGRQFSDGEQLLQWSYDLNGDGKPDYLISQSRKAYDRGGAEWAVYLSLPRTEGYASAGSITLDPDNISILTEGEDASKPAIVALYPRGGGEATLVAYRFRGAELQQEKLGVIHTKPQDETQADRDLLQRYLAPAKKQETELVGLDTVMSPGEVKALPSAESDFYRVNNFISDPFEPNRSLVYTRASNEFIGYMVEGKFISLSEAGKHGLQVKRDPIAERAKIETEAKEKAAAQERATSR
jgi:hypothetical protein